MHSSTLVLLFVLALNGYVTGLQRYGFQNICPTGQGYLTLKSPIYGTSSSGIIVPVLSGSYTQGRNCLLILTPPGRNYGVVLSIRISDFRPNCMDQLTISSGSSSFPTQMLCNRFTYRNKIHDSYEYRTFASTSNINIQFQTFFGGSSTFAYDGFELVFTVFEIAPCYTDSWKFRCNTPRCIAKDLRCDGHNHCGDRSEQFSCGPGTGGVVGATIGGLFLLIAIICIVAILIRRQRRTKVTTGTTTITTYPPQPTQPLNTSVQYPPPPCYDTYANPEKNPGYYP